MHAINRENRKLRTASVAYLDRDGRHTYMVNVVANETGEKGYAVHVASVDRFAAFLDMHVTRAPNFKRRASVLNCTTI